MLAVNYCFIKYNLRCLTWFWIHLCFACKSEYSEEAILSEAATIHSSVLKKNWSENLQLIYRRIPCRSVILKKHCLLEHFEQDFLFLYRIGHLQAWPLENWQAYRQSHLSFQSSVLWSPDITVGVIVAKQRSRLCTKTLDFLK